MEDPILDIETFCELNLITTEDFKKYLEKKKIDASKQRACSKWLELSNKFFEEEY